MEEVAQAPQRVGLLIPSSNTVMEVDFYRHFAPPITVHTGRMLMESTTPEGEGRMLDKFTMPAAEAVATARPHVVVFGCTSAGALRGEAYDAALCQRIAQESGAFTISVIRSVREELNARGARRIGVITPYIDELNQKIRDSLEENDFEVADIVGLGIDENFLIAEVNPGAIVEFGQHHFGARDIDLLFASCTNFRALEAIPMLEAALGVPVVTSNQAALEAVRRHLSTADDSARAERGQRKNSGACPLSADGLIKGEQRGRNSSADSSSRSTEGDGGC